MFYALESERERKKFNCFLMYMRVVPVHDPRNHKAYMAYITTIELIFWLYAYIHAKTFPEEFERISSLLLSFD